MKKAPGIWILAIGVVMGTPLDAAKPILSGMGGVNIGLNVLGITALNQRLESHGLRLSSNIVGMGGMGIGVHKDVLIGGFGFGGSSTSENQNTQIGLSAGEGGVILGKAWGMAQGLVVLTSTFGGYGYSLALRPKLTDVDFDSLLTNPQRVSTLHSGGIFVGIGGMVIYPIVGPFFVGLHAGVSYAFTSNAGEWKLSDGAHVFNAPKIEPLRYTAQLLLLFGGRTNSEKE